MEDSRVLGFFFPQAFSRVGILAMTTAACHWCMQARVATTRQDLPRRVICTVSISRRLSLVPTSFPTSRNLERHGMMPERCSSTPVPEDTCAGVWGIPLSLIDQPRHSLVYYAASITLAGTSWTRRLHSTALTTMVAVMTRWMEVRAGSVSENARVV